MKRQDAAMFLKERTGKEKLQITTSEIFEEIAAIIELSETAEKKLKGVLMQLGEHMVVDDLKEEEWRIR